MNLRREHTAHMDRNFADEIYQEAKKVFPEGEIETLIQRAQGPAGQPGKLSAAVLLVHKPTRIQIACDDYPSQK